jgi:predicted membrane protein DUF2142
MLPPWYGPDEASHYAYVQEMVEDHWLARDHDPNAAIHYPKEILCSESNLDVGVLGAFHAEPPYGMPWVSCSATSPADRHATSPTNAAGGYSPVYYAAAIPYYLVVWPLNVDARLQAVRLWSVTLGAIAAVMTYLAATWAFAGDRRLSVAAAVFFTLQPMLSQQTAVVNNDALLIAVAATFWWRYFRALRSGITTSEAAVIGALVGLAYLAKQQGVLLAAALPFLYVFAPERPKFKLVPALRIAAAAAAPALAAAMVGELFTLAAKTSQAIETVPGTHSLRDYIWIYTVPRFEHIYFLYVTSFWGFFGWLQVALPNLAYVLIALAVVAGLIGVLLLLWRDRMSRRVVGATLLSVAICAGLLQLVEMYVYLRSGQVILQGRSFLMFLTPAVILLIWGWIRLVPRPATWLVAPAAVIAAAALNLLSLFVMGEAFFG